MIKIFLTLTIFVASLSFDVLAISDAQARTKLSIEDYCAAYHDADAATWRNCVGATYTKRFGDVGAGRCSKTNCIYKLKLLHETGTGNATYKDFGFTLHVFPWKAAGTGMPLGYRSTLIDPMGAVTHMTQSCGAACNFPADWDSGAHKGASYRDVFGYVYLTIPKTYSR